MTTGQLSEVMEMALEKLYVPVVCDMLDSLGYRSQAMHCRMRPLDEKHCRFIGAARTFQWVETPRPPESDPYGVELKAVDALRPGDVVVHSTDYSGKNAPWGELMTTAAKTRGAVACVCDSQVRDCLRIMAMQFPTFARGIRPLDSLGRARVIASDVPIWCGEVIVDPGDLVFGDYDGIVVIPRAVAVEALGGALEKVAKEDASRRELLQGTLLTRVYEKYGVL